MTNRIPARPHQLTPARSGRLRSLRRATAGALLVMAMLAAAPAGAQPVVSPLRIGLDTPAPTRGLFIPSGAIAGDADATSVALNPGQLGFVDGANSAFVLNQWDDDIEQEGRGFGLLLALPLGRSLVIGAGYEWLRPSQPLAEDYGKLTLGGGFRLGRALSFGIVWERLRTGRYGGLDTATYGFGFRPLDVLAAGFVVRDAFRPRLDGDLGPKLPRELDGEIAIRPTGRNDFEIAGGVRTLRGDGDNNRWLPHARLSARLLRGLALFADFEFARTRTINPVTLQRNDSDLRFAAGLAFSFDQTSLALSGLGTYQTENSLTHDSGGANPGFGMVIRGFDKRHPRLLGARSVARVKLAGLESDRRFLPMLLALRRMGDDDAVGAVLLNIQELDLGYGRIEELRRVVLELGKKKPVFAWLSQPETSEYYLASACHRVVMHPAGNLMLAGMAQTVTFWKGAMDKLGVAVDLVRIAEYKGAMEPFVLPQQSEPVRKNRDALLDDQYGRLVSGVVSARQDRGVDANAFQSAIDKALFSPAEAKDRNLIDEIADERQLEKYVQKTLNRRVSIHDADYRPFDSGRWQPRKVAVILVDGTIADGKPTGFSPTTAGVAWADPIVEALTAVRKDSSVRAVVLRVNSPGGSAFASDRIAREIVRLLEAKKPVVVSMADTAASGGYYVSAPADTIVASPGVITGSIGIFAFKVDVSGLAAKLGVNTETTSRGAHAALYSPWKPWDDSERQMVMQRLEQSYKQFLQVVAEGRKSRGIDEKRADQLGRGQVFTGAQARANNLVDRLGTFVDALSEASQRGNVPTGVGGLPEMVVLPKPTGDPLSTLLALRGLAGDDDDEDESSGLRFLTGSGPAPGAREGWQADASEAGSSAALLGAPAAAQAAAALLLPQGKTIRRLVLPVLLGPSTGFEARLPYELEFR